MNDTTDLYNQAMKMLLETSRTFFIPISLLEDDLKEAVGSAYLCMRAIDEIEDDEQLPPDEKAKLLYKVSELLAMPLDEAELKVLFQPYRDLLPEVTHRLADWASFSPASTEPAIRKYSAIMAQGMADWILKNWVIDTEEDLDDYTYYVAGLVGLMLSDIWEAEAGLITDREQAVAFGRGLQAVNIIRNREEDLERGVDFWPTGWDFADMVAYARKNLALADAYTESIKTSGTIYTFCQIPVTLAYGTLSALESGEEKLTRADVNELVKQVTDKREE